MARLPQRSDDVPVLGKHELTRYLGTECPKQLRLMLSTPAEQAAQGMPPKQPPRPGLQQIAAAGDEWAAEKLAELDTALGTTVLLGARQAPQPGGGVAFSPTPLATVGLRAAAPGNFLAEHEFDIGPAFEAAYGIGPLKTTHALSFSRLRPDLIEIRAASATTYEEALPDGRVVAVTGGDARVRLRVIDIKLTSQPGPGYLAEVVYYSVALAGWLADHGVAHQFAVEADPAIWPGSHTASAITEARNAAAATGQVLSVPEFLAALEAELVVFPYEVFAARLRHFFTAELPDVLAATPWQSLPFNVGTKCRGCDFLGQDWGPTNPGDPAHCLPTATTTDHLSRIPFVSRGALDLLAQNGAPTVGHVAVLMPADPVFNKHHTLRGQRTVLAGRASALAPGGTAGIPNLAGTSATIPSWSDLRVYVSADFDTSSALTLVFGVKAWWRQPSTFGVPAPAAGFATQSWQARPFLVDSRSLVAEEQQLVLFLAAIDQIIRDVKAEDARLGTTSTAQVYVWDDLTYRHLTRVVGRHLQAILNHQNGMRYLAWLFPPEEVLGTAKLVSDPVVSIVSNAVKNLLALPVPHHYSLLGTARAYHRTSVQPPWDEFRVPPLFEDPFSDQIPSERAHAIWTKAGGRYPWGAQAADLDRTIKVRLNALEEITAKLGEDLRGQLMRKAPPVTALAPPAAVSRLTPDELLILAYHKLNDAFQQNKTAQVRAMPPHQREARFACARLTRRLDGADRTTALATLGVTAGPDELVYEIRPGSEDAKFEDGAFSVAVVPEDRTVILDWSVRRLVGAAAAGTMGQAAYARLSGVLGVEIVKFDRVNRLVLLRWNSYHALTRQAVLATGLLNMDRNLSLEPAPQDFLGPRLETTLKAIGRTPKAVAPPAAAAALGLVQRRGPNPMPRVPVEDVLWDALAMSGQPVARPGTPGARAALDHAGHGLNQWQWSAWEHALTHRLSLLWGPPGTGKSRTLKNVIVGAALEAAGRGVPLRVLVSASTWRAVDNVLAPVAAALSGLVPQAEVFRLRTEDPVVGAQNLQNDKVLTAVTQPLADRLTTANTNITVVGSSSQQLHKFAVATGSATAPLFDLIVCDEASQTDVANAVLPLATLAEDGSVVVAGDPLQLPPIRQVDAPIGTEFLVGSLYEFLSEHHGVLCQALEVNYRSNKEIVAIAHQAKYRPALHAFSPDLRLNLLAPLPSGPTSPPGWPAGLAWSPALPGLLAPDEPVVCLVHPDALSGQSSDFEAQLVAGLASLLNGRAANGLTDDMDPATNAPRPASTTPYTPVELFREGLGIVSPHRAQISRIVSLLAAAGTGATPSQLREAVDSVERFQGQERDVIIASYAVGDPDTIADEDEFLQSLNRFNVMASRARAKLIVVLSETLVQHLPNDLDVLRGSALLKSFAETFCGRRSVVDLNWHDPGQPAGTVSTVRVSKRLP